MMRPIVVFIFSLSFLGCSSDVEVLTDAYSCVGKVDGIICEMKGDPSIVARCIEETCTPFGCDICPRLPYQNIACMDEVCHQSPIDNGSACVAFPDPLADSGVVGTCANGNCTGSFACMENSECSMVECTNTSCNNDGICVGFSVLPGTACTTASGEFGTCFNYTCTEPAN